VKMRRFLLYRHEDETGNTGTGVVAWGCEFPNGKVAITWALEVSSCTWFDDLEHVERIHGHGGKTRLVFADFAIDFAELDRLLAEPAPDDERLLRSYL
jgi:hypothetical protein